MIVLRYYEDRFVFVSTLDGLR